MRRSLNIILFGEAGIGKSSVINLIAGENVAETSDGAKGCTMSFKRYTFPINGRTYHIWDTVGLDTTETEMHAIEKAYELIRELGSHGGVDLLLLCMRGNLVTASTQANYRLFYEVFCKSQVPIAFVITHLEQEMAMENWWERNVEQLKKFGLKAAGHACVTGLPMHSKCAESRLNITRLLEGHGGNGRFNMPSNGWLVESLRLFGLSTLLKKDSNKREIMQVLVTRCGIDPRLAEELASNPKSRPDPGGSSVNDTSDRRDTLNIILFGQTGAGKSSVINLIAGRKMAETSNGAAGCTLSYERYAFPVNGRSYYIWDTVGLDEPEMELDAIGGACDLVQSLEKQGGVDLLLFCIRAPRITAASQANYRLFYEVLCRSRVPIALVITHLEREADMEGWWERNVNQLEKFGLKAASHACVTGLPAHSKFRESQENIAKLLQGHNNEGRFNMPPDALLVKSLRLIGLIASLRKDSKKKIMWVLVKRCRMDPTVAEEIVQKLED